MDEFIQKLSSSGPPGLYYFYVGVLIYLSLPHIQLK